jgi:hypothetical protein
VCELDLVFNFNKVPKLLIYCWKQSNAHSSVGLFHGSYWFSDIFF